MIGLFRSWLLGIVASALILSVIYSLVPSGRLRPAAKLVGGLALLMAVLGPLGMVELEWDSSYADCAWLVQEQIDAYRDAYQNRASEIIAGRVEAYISDKGNERGLVCHPTVTIRLEDGVPFPYSVVMDIPMDDGLASCIASDLGIPRERQIWRER